MAYSDYRESLLITDLRGKEKPWWTKSVINKDLLKRKSWNWGKVISKVHFSGIFWGISIIITSNKVWMNVMLQATQYHFEFWEGALFQKTLPFSVKCEAWPTGKCNLHFETDFSYLCFHVHVGRQIKTFWRIGS